MAGLYRLSLISLNPWFSVEPEYSYCVQEDLEVLNPPCIDLTEYKLKIDHFDQMHVLDEEGKVEGAENFRQVSLERIEECEIFRQVSLERSEGE